VAKNFGRGRDREPAVEVARCALLASHVRVSAASIQLLVPPGSPSARVRSPRPLCPKSRQTADRRGRSAWCHKRTYAVQEIALYSFDLLGAQFEIASCCVVIHLNDRVSDRR